MLSSISCKCFYFHTLPSAGCRLFASHLFRCSFAFSPSPCFSPHLCLCVSLSLVDREFKECGLGAPPVPNQLGIRRRSNEGSLERTPPVPPRHRAKKGTAEAGKPEQGDRVWKTLAVCFQGKNTLIRGGCGLCTVVFG